MVVLAETENWLVGVELAGIVVEIALTVVVTWIGIKQRESNSLTSDLKKNSERLIQEQLANHTSPLKQSIDSLTKEIAAIHKRLEEGEGDFKDIAENRLSMSVQLERRFGELKSFMSDTFASKTDLKDHEKSVAHKFEQVSDENNDIGRKVAVLSDRLGSK